MAQIHGLGAAIVVVVRPKLVLQEGLVLFVGSVDHLELFTFVGNHHRRDVEDCEGVSLTQFNVDLRVQFLLRKAFLRFFGGLFSFFALSLFVLRTLNHG